MVDAKTQTIIHANDKMMTFLGEGSHFIGMKFSDYVNTNTQVECQNDNSIYPNLEKIDWSTTNIYREYIFERVLQLHFEVVITCIPDSENPILLIAYSIIYEDLDAFTAFEGTMIKVLAALHLKGTKKIDKSLEILGEFYGADKTYFFLLSDNKKILQSHQWTSQKNSSTVSDFDFILDNKKLSDWLDTRNEFGIIEIDKNHSAHIENSLEGDILRAFQSDNLVISVLEDINHRPTGFLLVNNSSNQSNDLRVLRSMTRFIEKGTGTVNYQIPQEKKPDRDKLTGLYNRASYASQVDKLNTNPPNKLGIFLADVNGLKKTNAEFGYAKGDALIKEASELMVDHFGPELYRIAGDEFVGFFPNIDEKQFEEYIISLNQRLRKKENCLLFAIGHAWGTGRYDCRNLIHEADAKMFIDKQEYYHSSNCRTEEIADLTLAELFSYLDNDEFMIYLQPQVKLKDSALYGAEALIRRFDKKNQKMVFPDQFIPLYEQKSIIRHIDLFVVESVCKLLREWINEGKEIPISVNLSRVTLQEYGIVDSIVEICDRYKVPHHLLVLEVTERIGLIENNIASALIEAFKKHGFHISLDDFGCAYSNIVTLAQIEVDEVKIDKSLVDNLMTNKKNRTLVKNIVHMCNELEGSSTLAEGIETAEQAKLLYEFGCHLGQGYFYSRPIPVEEFYERYIG